MDINDNRQQKAVNLGFKVLP